MNKTVTPEMISAFVDGELSPEDKLSVENALHADVELREIADGFQALRSSVQSSSEYIAATVRLPKHFASNVMGKIDQLSESVDQELDDENGQVSEGSRLNRPTSMSGIYSVRTLIEVVVAMAAIVLIVVNWPSSVSDPDRPSSDSIASADSKSDIGNKEKKSGVRMLSVGDGKEASTTRKNGGTGATQPTEETSNVNSSREFSIFVNESARPNIDRFWIMKSYEVDAPEQEPDGRVNMLLIDAKKADAVKFFDDLKKWDANFKVFQDSGKSPNATWLAPFDASKIDAAEGDFWKLRIVLIGK